LHVVHPLVRAYYQRKWALSGYGLWKFQRKHFRAELSDGAFLKLNRRWARLDGKDLRRIASDLAPKHLFMSVLDYRALSRYRSSTGRVKNSNQPIWARESLEED
jgi:CRISPR/Cas system-associated endoribonuclease Cas2